MRGLKFRTWNWVEGRYDKNPCAFLTISGELTPSVNRIIEQYTGFKDKNGERIYEGDIIQEEIDFNSKMTDGVFTYVVEWDNDTLSYSLRGNGNSIHDELWQTNLSRRVIGNIHENPELLGDTNVTNKER